MEFSTAKAAIHDVLRKVAPVHLPRLVEWMQTNDFDEYCTDNNEILLRSIAEDLRNCLPVGAVLSSEPLAFKKTHQKQDPTVNVDAFLYDDDLIDSLCEQGKMSRNYCLSCGSHDTAPLSFISHSFSPLEIKFLFHHVLPDLAGKILIDVGSRLGAVLFGGYLYSAASQIIGVEMNEDFCHLQQLMIQKYQFTDRVQVICGNICAQGSLLQNADVIVMNNVFEYFLEEEEQVRSWQFINSALKKKGMLLVTTPSLQESLSQLQTGVQLKQWVREVPLDYNVYLGKDTDTEALKQFHLYEVL
ncbi:uncharacterized protein zgc:109986 [Callorhinchus milii]|uniref:Arsenite methyltransferase n=1 Tax=Callorhinchus milii TaxID=7868 RepID=A0A4W3GMZ9_CALMI|nr:uncharacterized protein zgc:109986 [Callorhinchus milii]|eukprot:gi/632951915/ref/XP_007891560.1/ PREDICTED: uncharacterized protein LOC103178550 [Callorhinchus milii]